MATFSSFEEIEAWQRARVLTREIYAVSKKGDFARDFGLRDQIQRASVSVMANIAEGHERGGTAEFRQFLANAKGSAGEVRSHLYAAFDQGYISKDEFDRLYGIDIEAARLIGGLMNYLGKSELKGTKYREL